MKFRMAIRVVLFLTLTGLCVADFTGNLALRATVVQSSTIYGGEAKRAVDGNMDSNWYNAACTHTNWDWAPWWRVDLGKVYDVSRVNILSRGDAVWRINGAEIRIGNSLGNNGNNNELAATVESIPAGVKKTFEFKSIKGRYVNIVIPGRNEYLTLCEVEVFSEKYTSTYTSVPIVDTPLCSCVSISRNLARGAAVVQSSTNYGGEAKRAVDGNRDSDMFHDSCSATAWGSDSWWRVDLGQEYKVTRVIITNRGDAVAQSINGAQIRIGNSLENNGNNNELAATVESTRAGETKTIDFQPINGQYVNIFLPAGHRYLSLCEVEVFAEKYTSTYTCFPRNLALGAKAVQSSTHNGAEAQRAVDGISLIIQHHRSCSHTDANQDPWWRVDLGEIYEVTRVSINNHRNHADRTNGAEIRIGNSLDNNGNNNELAATVVSIPAGETKTFEFKPIKGRYVNIYIPGRKTHLTLCEVEVFAD